MRLSIVAVKNTLVLAVALALIALSGCGGSGVSQLRFDKLKIGMTRVEIEGVLGKNGVDASADEVVSLMREALTKERKPICPI
jgi:hypothetical protein